MKVCTTGCLLPADLAELEAGKNAHIADLMARHEAAFRDMQAYYSQARGGCIHVAGQRLPAPVPPHHACG